MEEKKYYYGIDLIKYLMVFCIMAIHLQPLEMFGKSVNESLNIIIRLAVPFFFCCSGFFLRTKLDKTKDDKNYKKVTLSYIKRVLWLYLIWTIIYLPCIIFWYITDKKTPLIQLKEIFFDGSYVHLWYLPSLAVAITIAAFLYKRIKVQYMFIIALILYIVGLTDTVWYKWISHNFMWIKRILDNYNEFFITTRNGLFFGFVFVILGFMAVDIRIKMKKAVIAFIACFVLLTIEFYLYFTYKTAESFESFIMSIGCVFTLFLLAKGIKLKKKPWLDYFRIGGVIIYFIHCLVDFSYSILCFNILHTSFNSMTRYFYTLIISVVLSIVLYRLQKKPKLYWIRKMF